MRLGALCAACRTLFSAAPQPPTGAPQPGSHSLAGAAAAGRRPLAEHPLVGTPEAWARMAVCHRALGDLPGALRVYQELVARELVVFFCCLLGSKSACWLLIVCSSLCYCTGWRLY